MAMPYPEGEVYFQRSTLKCTDSNPENMIEIASHVLVEYIYNRPHEGTGGPRARTIYADYKTTQHGHPNKIILMFKENADDEKPRRILRVDPCPDGEAYEQGRGGVDRVLIRPISVTPRDGYMFMDLEVPLRAVYLPLAPRVDSRYPDLRTYLMVTFRFRKGAHILRDRCGMYTVGKLADTSSGSTTVEQSVAPVPLPGVEEVASESTMAGSVAEELPLAAPVTTIPSGPGGSGYVNKTGDFHWHDFNNKDGLGLRSRETIRLDLRGIFNYLVLPRQMRSATKALFRPEKKCDSLIVFDHIDTHRVMEKDWITDTQSWGSKVEYLDVIKDNFGIDVVWKPYEYQEEARSLIGNLASTIGATGLSLIPVVGPLASVAWVAFIDAIYDPEGFKSRNVLQFDEDLLGSILDTAAQVAENLPKAKSGTTAVKFSGAAAAAVK
ncbi:uncharacterized protein B0I36DRAFT_363208 [Microdochium trichocladiopsis]|uniref:Uncharacterized protein n=1 Tax=Microdochium trichocladiopsis TaxID=1682393 RepID=A0A9P8YA21_9PEZI|nr:uncharacterized protein B0I36DRAFT_363208 [Microdochium trichocladiopsis]KAH7031529.1 hypothetical protein B0I36DRAFT_363208 [Microdochium trichocladiopsis]